MECESGVGSNGEDSGTTSELDICSGNGNVSGTSENEGDMVNENSRETSNSTPEQRWRGCSMEEIYRNLNVFELDHVAAVRPAADHAVLHHYPIRNPNSEPPRPLKSHHKWDALHVRLPCSVKSQYPVTAEDGSVSIESRWEMIEQALLRPISNSHELQAAVLTYNSKYDGQWNFRALHNLFEEELDESESRVFFEDLLPRIIRLALRLPELLQAPIPLLKQGQNQSVTLTQEQISCLLANAFLCTFPRRNTLKRKSEYSSFPDINFNRLFQSSGHKILEKIKCICHYFRRVCPTERDNSNVPTGVVTFTRRSVKNADLPSWESCDIPLGITPLHITSTGTIEDQGLGLLQVDFANKYLGGGVLGSGCVQEEIRFVICPELLLSKLFTECLRPTEALLMVGCERFSNYTGYAGSFQWAGNHEDNLPRDSSRRRLTHIVAIDALAFAQSTHQYREELMQRELNKAYAGFLHTLETPAPGVASGNWGCGAFGGEAKLKALLQLMACTVTKRPLVYFTFGDVQLRDEVHRLHTFFIEQNVRVKDLWATLRKFKGENLAEEQLYDFIYKCHSKKHSLNWKKTPAQRNSKAHCTAVNNNSSGKGALTTTKSAWTKKSFAVATVNTSQDIFASSSESEAEQNNVTNTVTINVSAKSSSSKHTLIKCDNSELLISDESETDVVLLAAVNDIPELDVASSSSSKKSNSNSKLQEQKIVNIPKTPTKQRQRTLLEMLDQCYTQDGVVVASNTDCTGGSPASKRHKAGSKN